MRVDEEEYEDLAVTGLGGIFQSEGRDEVLVDIREGDAPVLFSGDLADVLHTVLLPERRIDQKLDS